MGGVFVATRHLRVLKSASDSGLVEKVPKYAGRLFIWNMQWILILKIALNTPPAQHIGTLSFCGQAARTVNWSRVWTARHSVHCMYY